MRWRRRGEGRSHAATLSPLSSSQQEGEDAVWLARMGCGDLDALSMLYDRHVATVYGLANTMLGEGPDAAAVTEQVFIALWRQSAELGGDSPSVRGWLVASVYRHVLELIESC
jgi:RNA polymerase sigma-70 factor (ECF subfamily)